MKTVIEMAHEVGFGGTASEFQIKAIERFIDLIRADEREACAVIVSEQYEGFSKEHQGVQYVKQRILEAIRARGNK